MKSAASNVPAIAISVKVYQILLAVYPAKFREEYGAEMLQLFRDCCVRAFDQNKINGMLGLWAMTLPDLIRSVIAEHLHKEIGMTNPKFIRFSGFALLTGFASFLPFLIAEILLETRFSLLVNGWYVSDILQVSALTYACLLLPIGILGLRLRYGRQIGTFGRGALTAGVLGGCGFYILLLSSRMWGGLYVPFVIFHSGYLLMFLSLFIFGILTLRYKILSQGNGLPLAAGLIMPLSFKYYGILAGIRFLGENPLFLLPSIIGFLVMTVALMRFGYIVQADQAREMANA